MESPPNRFREDLLRYTPGMLESGIYTTTPLDRDSLPQSSLNIANRVRTNPLPWNGQFSPQFVEELLTAYAPRSGVVLDPFVGSGTSLVEAARAGLGAWGGDLNPAAVALASVYTLANATLTRRAKILGQLRRRVYDAIGLPEGPLFSGDTVGALGPEAIKSQLTALWRSAPVGYHRCLAAALIVLSDFRPEGIDTRTVSKTWRRLENTVRTLPQAAQPITVLGADARALPVESNSVDVVLTSPPYINVHNYHQNFRRSVEALNCNVLRVARSEIGSNRQNRGNRYLTVIQYSLDMALALLEMGRVAKAEAPLMLVLGRESTVRGTPFYNGRLVAEIGGRAVGLTPVMRQERVFLNRYGKKIFEDILHFRAPSGTVDVSAALATARRIAHDVLLESRVRAPAEERKGVDDALERVQDAAPSPTHVASVASIA